MSGLRTRVKGLIWMLAGVAFGALFAGTGCQVEVGGQMLPSPYYLKDDVQYYAPGTEFKLAREAAALKEAQAQENQAPENQVQPNQAQQNQGQPNQAQPNQAQ